MKRTGFAAIAVVAMALVSSPAVAGSTVVGHSRLLGLQHRANATTSSTNWSGYATYNATFTDVKGSWTQPAASCSKTAYSSFWVGIDGYKSSSVEQIGTDSDCSGSSPKYYAWYEMYPNPMVTISGFAVQPGDVISAEVSVSGSTYTLTLSSSSGAHFSASQSTSASNASAEWVAEAPSSCFLVCRVLPLANFHTVNFTGSYTTANGVVGSISAFTNDKIVMASQGGTVKAQPSALSADGTGFSVTWKHS